ncbi:two-component sensor histidine kinase BceS [Aeromicrobium ponti]|uniref:histidine kinase n=1 Tax=Cytobacillus oceanisediminis TaxID=665099 RepID=A0A562K5E0_9BACI|nr:sensor histidine kinase [Cytobacillus oceanisediminis]TWH90661.1 two-component system, OmpR family, bacitracin resistance sensor histidine kinase BceS [Cytobacillus oceanisediminis]
MFSRYVRERLSWILLFLFLQILAAFIIYIDSALSLKPFLYCSFLSLLIFIGFFILRFQKETKFYKAIEEREENLDMTSMPEPGSPFEEIVESGIVNQTGRFKRELTQNRTLLEQEKDDLLSWIHEVKTPLTAMHLMIDRLEDHNLKTALTYEWLRIHLLLDQQLHQKRIPFMENDLYIEKTNLEDIIFSEIKSLQSWCMQKGIGFEVELEESEILSDAKWLSFIIRQILTNAVKYSEESDINVLSFQRDGQVIMEFQDFGRGIDPKDLPRIFEKGFTSTVNHQDQSATGMGLYLAKKAAEPLKITILVESEPRKGSTFTLIFPKRNEFVSITGM